MRISDRVVRMTHALVTGANRGIGFHIAKELAARGASVVAATRSATKAFEGSSVTVRTGLELRDPESIRAFAAGLDDTPIDLLVHNAGVARITSLDDPDPAAITLQFEVNALAPLLLTAALRGKLAKGAKVALITSRMGSIADNGSGGQYGYRMSKAAMNMAGKSLAVDLRDEGVAVAILHPGMVATDMLQGLVGEGNDFPTGTQQAADVAKLLLTRIDKLTLSNTGTFWHANGDVLPW